MKKKIKPYLAETMSPVFTFGRFFFVAPSNARYEREAGSPVPM